MRARHDFTICLRLFHDPPCRSLCCGISGSPCNGTGVGGYGTRPDLTRSARGVEFLVVHPTVSSAMDGRVVIASCGGAGLLALVGVGIVFALSHIAPAPLDRRFSADPLLFEAALESPLESPEATASLPRAPVAKVVAEPPTTDALSGRGASAAVSPVAPIELHRLRKPARTGTEVILAARGDELTGQQSLIDAARRPPRKPLLNEVPEARVGGAKRRELAMIPDASRDTIVQSPRVQPSTGVLTHGEIAQMRRALRLTPDQEPYWPSVEALLRELGTQQIALMRAGGKPEDVFNSRGITGRLYWAAGPLLARLRDDQKAEVRKRARLMGFASVASMI
jgi:hypothetical protein